MMKDNYKILIVDDENKSRLWLSEILTRIAPGADIHSSGYPLLALDMLAKDNYDLLFLDYEMPQMNGLEMMRKIEAMRLSPHIVLISAYKEFDFAQKGIEIGVLDYIVKPFNDKQISIVIDKFKDRQSALSSTTATGIIVLSTINGDCLIKKDLICMIEVEGRNLLKVALQDGTRLCVRSSLERIYADLTDSYIYITRQCIVNRNNIKLINAKANTITLFIDGKEVLFSCSRNHMKELIKWRDELRQGGV